MASETSEFSHAFTNPAMVLAKYYCGILPLDRFVIIMKQLPFTVQQINGAIDEVIAFADSVQTADKSKSTKLDTALSKLFKYVMMR